MLFFLLSLSLVLLFTFLLLLALVLLVLLVSHLTLRCMDFHHCSLLLLQGLQILWLPDALGTLSFLLSYPF